MDIFNKIPEIAEDTLTYRLYPVSTPTDRASITSLSAIILDFVNELLVNHIWHRDSFELKVSEDEGLGKDEWCMQGLTRVGDCIDDEWFVVWLLKEISVRWGLAIRAFDSDGEFMLIEAADFLPSWVTPTNAENRVWIYKGHIHLIPLSVVSAPSSRPKPSQKFQDFDDNELEEEGDQADYLAVFDALRTLHSSALETQADSAVEGAVWQRINGYPDRLRQHVHVTKAYLPVDISKALSSKPTLIQKAVETFYTRDAEHLRYAHRMSRFPPAPNALTSVKLTRTAYAQLVGQKFHPPKIFGPFKAREGTKEWRWRDIGMKIACGFEMLYQETKNASKTSGPFVKVTEETITALKRDKQYTEYLQSLVRAGYFKGELEGSQLWKELERKAVTVFLDSRRDNENTRQPFASLVNEAVEQAVQTPQLEEEPDDWLNVDATDFDAKLEATLGKSAAANAMDVDKSHEEKENEVAQEQAEKLRGLAKQVEDFVEGEGTLEGALFQGEGSDDEGDDDDSSDDSEVAEAQKDGDNAADQAARRAAMDRLVPALDPSDYGKMPASFYSSSQRTARVQDSTDPNDAQIDPENKNEQPSSSTDTNARPLRRPVFAKERYDGVDSDDETDEEDVEEDEEDKPQLVGDVEIDMGEEEEEFLEFSRQALGISDEHWQDILRVRKGRGAFIPEGALGKSTSTDSKAKGNAVQRVAEDLEEEEELPGKRTDLQTFEDVMQAMDEELARARATKHLEKLGSSNSSKKTKPKPKVDKEKGKATTLETVLEQEQDHGMDLEDEMDAELRGALARDGDGSEDEEMPMDYNLIKNFLESFRSQGGLSGPVGNLAGRLQPGWGLPRDDS